MSLSHVLLYVVCSGSNAPRTVTSLLPLFQATEGWQPPFRDRDPATKRQRNGGTVTVTVAPLQGRTVLELREDEVEPCCDVVKAWLIPELDARASKFAVNVDGDAKTNVDVGMMASSDAERSQRLCRTPSRTLRMIRSLGRKV
ncbi:hypothetical protein DFH06DRAFT_1145016 [Mycena polygramma]|nr:hypothetical protein DFH06DRAFT_1145016 [Mycena polygramma]